MPAGEGWISHTRNFLLSPTVGTGRHFEFRLSRVRTCLRIVPRQVPNSLPHPSTMKRSFSDSIESEDDSVFEETKGSPSQSCQMSSRKKRRGIIEKRRRDRINNCLAELRRLVPTAFEKQGSAKLEKAEILQMTVDYLKMLAAKGYHAYDDHFIDYRGIGFRECANEVARYMVTIEGLDIQDPLRIRLMNHLQCIAAQREAQVVAAAGMRHTSPWNVNGVTAPHPQFASVQAAPDAQGLLHATSLHEPPRQPAAIACSTPNTYLKTSAHLPVAASVPASSTAQISPTLISSTQFPVTFNTLHLSPTGYGTTSTTQSQIITKPYRPWGSEVNAY
ncbi:hairy/enhancer-of-split related with YRPW motif protein 1-like [Branchiostoma floridae]|uniref:Hairy/enhancer-of-split related with YRPW motif protein 1-like n=2 Tax=Branchiostoma floridae TaxID=7739 RepID=A0A9J7HGE8_BRAFL|nr:hairy/enhancer-of-split related with YRPW motif protein 1-like [Branchiostoma floridae]